MDVSWCFKPNNAARLVVWSCRVLLEFDEPKINWNLTTKLQRRGGAHAQWKKMALLQLYKKWAAVRTSTVKEHQESEIVIQRTGQ